MLCYENAAPVIPRHLKTQVRRAFSPKITTSYNNEQ